MFNHPLFKDKESIQTTLLVAFLLCLVCAIVVSVSAVALKPLQDANQELDRRSNILIAAGIISAKEATRDRITEEFSKVKVRVVDLQTGELTDSVDPETYNQLLAAKESESSFALKQPAIGMQRIEKYGLVYLLGEDENQPERIIIPVRGPGLWSTLHGFIALKGDGNTLSGLGFYEHAETPGLGGEVDNPNWKAQWPGKKAYAETGEPALGLARQPNAEHEVDTLAGASLTARGVTNLLQFWISDQAYGAFLAKFRNGGA